VPPALVVSGFRVKKSAIFYRPINENHRYEINMSVIRATIYLKSGSGVRPYRSCYFSEREYERLLKDFADYQGQGTPQSGIYTEEISGDDEQIVVITFGDIAEIRSNQ
jgi:hypothetical protein